MTLAKRVSAFFLTALAVVLVLFSVTMYWLRAEDLERETEDRLNAAIDTIAVAIEVREETVEWEPHRRVLYVGGRTREDALPWCVRDPDGKILSRSRPRFADQFFQLVGLPVLTAESQTAEPRDIDWMRQSWRVLQRRYLPSPPDPSLIGQEHAPLANGSASPTPPELTALPTATAATVRARDTNPPRPFPDRPSNWDEEDDGFDTGGLFSELTVQAAVPLQPMRAELRRLATWLMGVSASIWLLAALVGHGWCRRALLPVSAMAESAKHINIDGHQQRLPVSSTCDELEELGRSFNGLLDRLQESFERQRRFTGDASHQLRTPLTVMLGQLEVALRRDERPAADYRQTLIVLQNQARRLSGLVELLLFLARADAESQRPERQRLDVAECLRSHAEHWRHSPRGTDLQLDIPADTPLWINSHPALLTQVLDNLVENAFAYSPAGSPVRVRAEQDATHVRISVSDHGCGIPTADRDNLFHPFYRSEEARRLRPQGTGLGLAVAHRIVTVLEGEITVAPNDPRGMTFTLRFALAQSVLHDQSPLETGSVSEFGNVRSLMAATVLPSGSAVSNRVETAIGATPAIQ